MHAGQVRWHSIRCQPTEPRACHTGTAFDVDRGTTRGPSTYPSQKSDAIGTIYDAAIDPSVWPRALEHMCKTIDASFGSITIVDPHGSDVRVISRWVGDPLWLAKLDAQYAVMMAFMSVLDRFEVGEPFSMPMAAEILGDPDVWSSEFVTDWQPPPGSRIRPAWSCNAPPIDWPQWRLVPAFGVDSFLPQSSK